MTTITIDRAVVEQALEALTPWADSDHTVQHAAYHALKAAQEQAQAMVKPVRCPASHVCDCQEAGQPCALAASKPVEEPVSEMLVDDLCLLHLGWKSGADADNDLYRAAMDRVIARAVEVRGLRKIKQLEGKA